MSLAPTAPAAFPSPPRGRPPRPFWLVLSWSSIGACLMLLPGLLWGVVHIQSSTAAVSQWLPADGEQSRQYAQFLEWFDDDLLLLLAWDDCPIDDPRLPQFADALRQRIQLDQRLPIRRVVTSAEVIDRLEQGPAELSRAAAVTRVRGVFVGRDEAAVVLLELTGAQPAQYAAVVELVTQTAQETLGLSRAQLKLGGGVYEAVMVDEASDRSLKRFVIPSSMAALVVAWLCIRSIRLTLLVLTIAAYCQVAGVAAIYYSGGQLNAVLIVLPTLVFMLTVSAGVHLVNYYRDAGGPDQPTAGLKAVQAGFVPCVLATATTAIGFLSLTVSQLKPVRDFGMYSALAVVCSTAILLLTFPALVGILGQVATGRPLPGSRGQAWTAWKAQVIHWILGRANSVALVATAAVLCGGLGLAWLTATVKIENMFEPQSEILQNYTWLEEHIGPLISVEAVLNFSPDCSLDDVQRAELLVQVHSAIARVPEVGGTYSALTFMPPIPASGGIRNTARRAVFRKLLQAEKSQLASEGVLAIDASGEHWRVTAKVPVLHSLNYGELTERIRQACGPVEPKIAATPGVSLTFTGLNPVFHEAQQLLFSDLAYSFAMAFLLITPIMMLVLRSWSGGLLAMLPNVAPVALVFGAMGWMNIPLDIASILTASVALGIAVDDTLHFITWFRRGRSQGDTVTGATRFAFDKCASAMLQTTCICGAAMLVFIPTEFIPTRKFAILMSLMLAAAVVGDLILLPALLASRLGRWIYRTPNSA
jgi:predicted RND superfamily exporter protein